MKKKLLVGLAIGMLSVGMLGSASALTIDTNAGWDGSTNSGWYGSGQSLSVDSIENHFDSIGFYFDIDSYGNTFDFILSDQLNGGGTLFSTSFVVSNGINIIDIDLDMTANSTIFALMDYNGFNGRTAQFSFTDSYAGGNSSFGPIGSQSDYKGLDHRFIAEFSSGANAVPEPGTMLLMGTGLLGLVGYSRKRIKK